MMIKPIFQFDHQSKILIIGPAPGIRAHNSNLPWNDASGVRLRSWLDVTGEQFYNPQLFALISMNYWYLGVDKNGADLAPSLAAAELWHRPLLKLLPNIKLTILAGYLAQKYYLKDTVKESLTNTVAHWRSYWPQIAVIPHPSWHNNNWLKLHPWFELEALPVLQARIRKIIGA